MLAKKTGAKGSLTATSIVTKSLQHDIDGVVIFAISGTVPRLISGKIPAATALSGRHIHLKELETFPQSIAPQGILFFDLAVMLAALIIHSIHCQELPFCWF